MFGVFGVFAGGGCDDDYDGGGFPSGVFGTIHIPY